ncbi:MAG: hypothetical protein MHM6MM_004684 [Cercozoa sp. M6MM]
MTSSARISYGEYLRDKCQVDVDNADDGRGRRLVARKDFEVGRTVFRDTAVVSYPIKRSTHCARCLAETRVYNCKRCKIAHYCGRKCQKLDWPQHKLECSIVAGEERCSTTAVLAIRLLQMRASRKEKFQTGDYDVFDALDASQSDPLPCGEAEEEKRALAALLWNLLRKRSNFDFGGRTSVQEQVELVNSTLSLITRNAASVCDAELELRGVGFFPLVACVNHDCAPNCALVFSLSPQGITVQMRTMRPVQQGEELTISYVDLLDTFETRSETLYRHYGFQPTLRDDVFGRARGRRDKAACAFNNGAEVRLEQRLLSQNVANVEEEVQKQLEKQRKELLKRSQQATDVKTLRNVAGEQRKLLGPRHADLVSTLRRLVTALIDAADYASALDVCIEVCDAMQFLLLLPREEGDSDDSLYRRTASPVLAVQYRTFPPYPTAYCLVSNNPVFEQWWRPNWPGTSVAATLPRTFSKRHLDSSPSRTAVSIR